ncbi:homeodomain-containing protein [Paraburkholderia unamae]|nr:homeodomain-containing protein [Paraburkholderia unamae]
MASSRLPNDLAYSKQVLDCIYTFGLLMARLCLAPMDFACTGMLTMSMRELDRLKVIEAVTEARLMPWRAAERLGISRRQVERLVLRYRESGASGLVSRRRGGASNHQLPAGLAQRALEILRERYADFGPTLACEKLAECNGLVLSRETVRKLMPDAGRRTPDAGRRTLDSTRPAPAEGLPATRAPGLPGRAHPDRRQRPPLVRGTCTSLHAAFDAALAFGLKRGEPNGHLRDQFGASPANTPRPCSCIM